MNPITKKLVLEMLSYSYSREIQQADVYIKEAHEKLGEIDFNIINNNLIGWINPRDHLSYTDLENYPLYEDFMDPEDFEYIYSKFRLFFKYIPELHHLFVLKDQHIEFAPNLSKSDIQEIYKFVEDNYVLNPKHFRRYHKPD